MDLRSSLKVEGNILKKTNYAHLDRGSINLIDVSATYILGTVGT